MKRLTVVTKQWVGALADVSFILSKARVHVEDLTVLSEGDRAVVQLFCQLPERAKMALESNGYKVLESDRMVFARLPNEPESRARILRAVGPVKVSEPECLSVSQDYSIVGFKVSNRAAAARALGPAMVEQTLNL
ncbi:MAG: hypothetical protein KGH63_02845 [Candidatus Micrarchaeota archaeon]|nr:hypothetical protein [Candidatus Micrarchaeota archaeon]